LGGRKGIRPVKTELWGAGVVVCLERGADLQMTQIMPLPLTVSCFNKIQIGFIFLGYRLTWVILEKGRQMVLGVCASIIWHGIEKTKTNTITPAIQQSKDKKSIHNLKILKIC